VKFSGRFEPSSSWSLARRVLLGGTTTLASAVPQAFDERVRSRVLARTWRWVMAPAFRFALAAVLSVGFASSALATQLSVETWGQWTGAPGQLVFYGN
jgi:hypothetical protein